MERIGHRILIVIFLLISFAFLTKTYGFKRYEKGSQTHNLGHIPLHVEDWVGKRSPIKEKVYRILETDAVLVNQYRNGEDLVSLSIVYYPDAKVEFHTPEGCNSGKGDIVEQLGTRKVAIRLPKGTIYLYVNGFLVSRSNGEKDLFYYFFKSGDHVGNKYLRLRLEMAMKTIQGRETSGALIVVSTSLKDDLPSAERLLGGFLHLLYPSIVQNV